MIFYISISIYFIFYKSYISVFSGVVGCIKLPNPSLNDLFNLLSIDLQYSLSFEWPDFGLKCLLTVVSKDQLPKFEARVWKFQISQTNNKCNSLFRPADSNVLTKWNSKERYSKLGVYFLNKLAFQSVQKFTFSLRWSKI